MSHDVELQQLSTLFFNQDTVISREMMEHAFNEWTARQIYTEDSVLILQLGLYFIFIREMMHHLNVTQIQYIEVA
ncbi:hypothetical protein A3K93_03260 [Acinetobacter sp. NCu2D-2]|uniref:hypothetical protein n=1 Tax=Acinetobacter sp. NCu2D-2 TaxID=1608473 RepID=UPI0007CDB855|nr:hypothetical protein [Acinetobacter sp. NCu2D-2]ANF81308.1 hypothetical protein A3K93_03260 [Acinetobacter sp. NCu2D-2]